MCSRLAASWFWDRSDSVRRRTTSSSPVTERSSVWSRSVTTEPTSRPSQQRGRCGDDEDPVAGEVEVVGLGGAAAGGGDQSGRQVEVLDPGADHVVRQRQQAPRLVVDQLHAPLPVEQEQTFADRVEDGGVVLVHPGHLTLAHAMGQPVQASAQQPGTGQPHGQHQRAAQQHDRDVAPEPAVDVADRDADGHERDDLVAVLDRYHRADRRAERPGVLLGEDLAVGRATEVADELSADLTRIGVGVAGAVQVHHHDEVGVGVAAYLLGPGLEGRRRVLAAQRRADGGGVGDGLGDGHRALGGAAVGVALGVVGGHQDAGDDEQQHRGELKEKHLLGHRPIAENAGAERVDTGHDNILDHLRCVDVIVATNTTNTTVTVVTFSRRVARVAPEGRTHRTRRNDEYDHH